MLSWFRDHFLPHDGNEHRPHMLRHETLRDFAAIVLIVELVAFIVPSLATLNLSPGIAAVLPAVLGELTNESRADKNLPPLDENPKLALAAQMKAEDMAEKGYFAHTSPDGKTPWYWIELAGYKYQYAGENLAVNFRDSKDVTNAWLRSPTHKQNIVKGQYTEMGTGVARGMYKGKKTVFVAQVYANPLPQNIPTTKFSQEPINLAKDTVLGATSENLPQQNARPTQFQKLAASPRHTSNLIIGTLLSLMLFALVFYVVIKKLKRHKHHPDLLGNALALCAIAGLVLLANYYLSIGGMEISNTYDYSIYSANSL